MNTNYTTHLICAPELSDTFKVSNINIKVGEFVSKNQLLISLNKNNDHIYINAIEDGQISYLFINIGDDINNGDLLLSMEVEELPTGFLDVVDQRCSQDSAEVDVANSLMIIPSAAKLASRLGVDLSLVNPNCITGYIGNEEVELFVKHELLKLQQLRKLLA
ncbi:biotin/lipoyl-containing protein [Deefgea sp. CFH1-16]|uniref:biotin/lipoyl-containing protein n=1 Tax=Deefgea sp. CFH1-16 TaxID=2675457 RepID=UPI0015F4BF9F|nr:biotin/lipoyl-containing protein [Deefgea sp. CFH1-16]MBM5574305.1 hypothetical protein [Deefgea sp. CFH1-16]